MWGSLATVVVAFIKSRRGRKVIITTKDGTIVHAEGLSLTELDTVLDRARSLAAIDPNQPSPPTVSVISETPNHTFERTRAGVAVLSGLRFTRGARRST
jgi:hypothetical protein